ncbi:MAG: amidohydrolase family protein [Gammaproteobacteria bacterium]|nr:amidohydrolase family protein [Gammaproteobacteria bacterium]
MESMPQYVRLESRTAQVIAALCVFVLAVSFTDSARAQEQVTVIRGGTLIDGNGGAPLQDASIVIEGNRIARISSGQRTDYPASAKVIDARGKYILPGLWDTHTHFRDWFAELLITNGVTSVLSYGGGVWLDIQAEGIANGKIYGPRFFRSKQPIGAIYQMTDEDRIASVIPASEEEVILQVEELIEAGSKVIKVYTPVTPEYLAVITQVAHAAGLPVSGHIGIGAREATLAGIDNLSHATGIAVDVLTPADLAKVPDMRVIDTGRIGVKFPSIGRPWDKTTERWGPNKDLIEYPLFIEDPRRLMMFGLMDRELAQGLIELLVENDVFIEGALGYIFRNVHDRVEEYREEDRRLLADPNLNYIPERYRDNILDYSILENIRPDELVLMKKGYRNFQWFFKAFVDAGGKIDIGQDTSSSYHATTLPGVAVAREMELLVDAGISPMQAIQAATKWPAEMLRQNSDLGTLEEGKLADLIVVNGNPLQDIAAVKDLHLVMKDGEVMQTGYHYGYKNPIPEDREFQLQFPDWTPSEIPTRIRSISPRVAQEGSDSFQLTVRGHEFTTSSVIQFDGETLPTTYINSAELRTNVPARLVTRVGTYAVRVHNRPPGWGTTNKANFFVKFK